MPSCLEHAYTCEPFALNRFHDAKKQTSQLLSKTESQKPFLDATEARNLDHVQALMKVLSLVGVGMRFGLLPLT